MESRLAVIREREEAEKARRELEEKLSKERGMKEKAELAKLQVEKERNEACKKFETLQKDKQQLATTVSLLKQSQSDSQEQLRQMKSALRLSTLFGFSILSR